MKTTHLLFIFLLFSLGVQAQSAFVSREKLFSQLKGFTSKQAAIDTLRVQLSRDLQKQQGDLQKKYREITKTYAPDDSEDVNTLQARLSKVDQEKFKLLLDEKKMQDSRVKTYNMQLDEQYAKDIKPYITKVEEAIQQYAKKNKLDTVWYLEELARALPYYNASKDITNEIAAAVNKNL